MNNDLFYQILEDVENKSDLKSNDIPSLDLYMDQIMTLFDVNLSDNKRYESDKLLTKTMINNYSKVGLLKPIKGKKYSKDHILQMLLIYSLKNTISIQEIKNVLEPYHDKTEKIEPLYDEFLKIKNNISHLITKTAKEFIETENIDMSDHDQITMVLLSMCTISNQFKCIAEKILDAYYIDQTKKEII